MHEMISGPEPKTDLALLYSYRHNIRWQDAAPRTSAQRQGPWVLKDLPPDCGVNAIRTDQNIRLMLPAGRMKSNGSVSLAHTACFGAE
jgi:hypothetical protein